MRKERKFKQNTVLTDGKHFIYLGWVFERDWTPTNNYGRKHTDYWNCSTYPKNLYVNGCRVIITANLQQIPGLWFQKGYHLQYFIPISKRLIHPDILTKLRDHGTNG